MQNLKAWEEAKLAIQAIDAHPNKPLQLEEDEPLRSQASTARLSPQQQRSFTVDRSRTEVAGTSGFAGFAARGKGDHGDDEGGEVPPPPVVKDHPL